MLSLFSTISLLIALLVILVRVDNLGWLSPPKLVFIFLTLDTFLPALINGKDGLLIQSPWWITGVTEYSIILAIFFGLVFYLMLLIGYCLIGVDKKISYYPYLTSPKKHTLIWATGLSAALVVYHYSHQILEAGSFFNYAANKSLDRFAGLGADRMWYEKYKLLNLKNIPLVVLFYFRSHFKSKKLIAIFVVSVLTFDGLASMSRGTLLFNLFPLVILSLNAKAKGLVSYMVPGLALIAVLVVFGGVRGSQMNEHFGSNGGFFSSALKATFKGEALLNSSAIIDFYGAAPLLAGKTYVDMLLMPVPRSIYPTKPDWYGIDDISRGAGWPPSSQHAVTAYGEAYANFGAAGVIGVGFLLGFVIRILLLRARSGSVVWIVYISYCGPAITTFMWMGFTGFINQLVVMVLGVILCGRLMGSK